MILKCFKYQTPVSEHIFELSTRFASLHKDLGASEWFLVCYSGNLYLFTYSSRELREAELTAMLQRLQLLPEKLKNPPEVFFDDQAAYQFLQLAAGILQEGGDSRLIEYVREMYGTLSDAGYVGAVFHNLFQRSILLHEKTRMETDYFRFATQSCDVFGEIARKIFGNLQQVQVQFVGESNESAEWLRALFREGCRKFTLLTQKVMYPDLYSQYAVQVLSPGRNPVLPATTDILLLFSAEHPGLELRSISRRMSRRGNAPLLIYDAVNSYAEKERLKKIYNVFYYDAQDLQYIITRNKDGLRDVRQKLEDWLEHEVEAFMRWLHSDARHQFVGIVGTTREMQRVFELISRIAQTDITVLIQGESGTGKELVAKAIHRLSKRASKPFVVVNCGAIPENLLESELFGHVKGAFTGAVTQKHGLFEEANHGTIFLDEIGELPPQLQVKLLRFLQEGEIKRVGSNETIRVDVRVLAATNKDLPKLVEAQQFRSDLYYRLNVIQIQLPPLRERKDDIPILATHFMRKYSSKLQKRVEELTPEALQALKAYSWPGNVRELENAIEHAVALTVNRTIGLNDLPEVLRRNHLHDYGDEGGGKRMTLKELEKHYIFETLQSCNWNYEIAARQLGIGRTTLWRKIKDFQLKKPA